MSKKLSLSNLTLLAALSLSTVAAYYSIIGLTAIFAGAVIPIIVMGSILEVGKITTTVWLRKYWHRSGIMLKLYLVPAVVLLAFLTSMGIFGFLSKAHSDQSLVSGDVQGKLAIYDEKIKTARENIEADRRQLKQMDEAVDQVMARSTSEEGATKANNIRKSQQRDRTALAKDIEANQKLVSSLNDEAAPIRAENRKVEAEVGPIKYIAAFIYGDNPDSNLLERAVRWVIILIVAVFDPLAIALVLAANASKEWDKEESEVINEESEPSYPPDDGPLTEDQIDQIVETAPEPIKFVDHGEHPKDFDEKGAEEPVVELSLPEPDPVEKPEPEKSILEQHPYLLTGFDHFKNTQPMVYKPEITVDSDIEIQKIEPVILAAGIDAERPGDYLDPQQEEIITDGVTKEATIRELDGDYVLVDGRHMHKDAAKSLRPDLFMIRPDGAKQTKSNFGAQFPTIANKGDTFVRVDVLPNRVFKFDGNRWIEINKETTDTYLHDEEYIRHLVSMIESGQYDIELLSDNEKIEIENFLVNKNN